MQRTYKYLSSFTVQVRMHKCRECGTETNNPSFCTSSCAASFNNRGVRRWGRSPKDRPKCIVCGNTSNRGAEKYCSSKCVGIHKSSIIFEKHKKKFLIGQRIPR